MSLEDFIDIRFGDPVVSLSLNTEALVTGSMMGRLFYYNFGLKFSRVLSEISDEFISGLWLSEDNTLFACIGDLKALKVDQPGGDRYYKQYITFDKIHTSMSCELSQVKMHKDSILMAVLEPTVSSDSLTHIVSPIYLVNLQTMHQSSFEGIRFAPYTVFFDFNARKLLYMEHQRHCRVLFLYKVKKTCEEIRTFDDKFGKVGFMKFYRKKIVYVQRQRVIRLMSQDGKDHGEIGRHRSYIVALNCVRIEKNEMFGRNKSSLAEATEDKADLENRTTCDTKDYIVSVDVDGNIRVWDDGRLAEEIFISKLPELTPAYRKAQYFSMGYPYLVDACGPRIVLTTDLGVLVIRSKELEHFSHTMS